MAEIIFSHVNKVFDGGVKAVNDFNLKIKHGEFAVFVGPSGCGKSTTLRMIAGLEDITSGELHIDGVLMNNLMPRQRDVAMVFQNYALYPHMNAYDNMAFGLRLNRLPSVRIEERVTDAAQMLSLDQFLDFLPRQLSGGQRQRVALGRSMVRRPKVFLLDEPLSNLDAKMRVQMRSEITRLHRKLANTFVYVTHDQLEAMTMGSLIVVMKDGFIQQAAPPQIVYDFPSNVFVAGFIGVPPMNIVSAQLLPDGSGALQLLVDGIALAVPPKIKARLTASKYIGSRVILGIRPENVRAAAASEPEALPFALSAKENLGNAYYLYGSINGGTAEMSLRFDGRGNPDAVKHVRLDLNYAHLFDAETECTILKQDLTL